MWQSILASFYGVAEANFPGIFLRFIELSDLPTVKLFYSVL